MASWRPDDWKNPKTYNPLREFDHTYGQRLHDAYEEGADALGKAVLEWGEGECDNKEHQANKLKLFDFMPTTSRFRCFECMEQFRAGIRAI